MATISDYKKALDEAESLKDVTAAFSELASIKIKQIRTEVEKNRYFFTEMSKVYRVVQLVAAKQGKKMPKNGKTLAIMITSNYRFYGKINNELIKFFLLNTSKLDCDKIVIGKIANNYLKSINYPLSYQPVIFSGDFPTADELKNLVQKTKNYERILVFHSQLKTLLNQTPKISDITETQNIAQTSKDKSTLSYIFEPEIEKIIAFFDNQITSLLLEQAFFESELSLVASRLVSMNEAETNAETSVKTQKRLLSQAQISSSNLKLLENISHLNRDMEKMI